MDSTRWMNERRQWNPMAVAGLGTLVAAGLVACGGGGGSSSPPVADSITVAGTAVKGAALSGATVGVKCASGTATATTASSGAYSVTIEGATLPCAVRVSGTGGEVFHSVVPGTGATGTFNANVTPLTEMVVAHLSGMSPSAFFDAFGSSTSVSALALTDAIAYVKSAVATVADLGSANPIADGLVVGDGQDQKIDAVVAALAAAGLSLESVTTAIIDNPAAPSVLAAPLAPSASDCAWLKSGRYHAINPEDFTRVSTAVLDAVTSSGTDPRGEPFVMTSEGDCQYRLDEPNFTTWLVASRSGVVRVHGQSTVDSERNFAILLPAQTLPVSEFAGTWIGASWSAVGSSTARVASIHELTIDSTGQATALVDCTGLAACVPQIGPFSRFTVNAVNGGFDEILPNGSTWSRVFLYKTLNNERIAVFITPENQFIIGTRRQAISPAPTVGVASAFRQIQLNGDGTISDATEDIHTVIAVDSTAKSVTRSRSSDGRVETINYDTPRDGFGYRAPNTCSLSGSPVNCAEAVQFTLQGMGIDIATSVGSSPAAAFFAISVNKP